MEIKVLDKGFVRLVDHMGSDAAIVQAARVSYGAGTKTVREDKGLINYLMKNRHTSPFEMNIVKFHIKLPIFIARQWIRHRTASVNEYSGRYSEMSDEFYLPSIDRLQKQAEDNKQGSSPELIDNPVTTRVNMEMHQRMSYRHYQQNLSTDLAREIARINLPLSNYTEWYWKIDLHNLFHFLKLRSDSHAQYEIREYANAIYEIIKPLFPLACDAWEEHVLYAQTFSRSQMDALKQFVEWHHNLHKEDLKHCSDKVNLSKREFQDFITKLGVSIDEN